MGSLNVLIEFYRTQFRKVFKYFFNQDMSTGIIYFLTEWMKVNYTVCAILSEFDNLL